MVDFASDITVTETIRVESEGKEIKRGIYRDFPTDYRDRHGNRVVVDFTVVEVLRDGWPEPFHTERLSNGVRVYIGEADVFIPKGPHVYRIAYRTDRQLGFFKGFDELYWNVTGDGWAFTIERARGSSCPKGRKSPTRPPIRGARANEVRPLPMASTRAARSGSRRQGRSRPAKA